MVCGVYRNCVEGSMSSKAGCKSSLLACLDVNLLVLGSSMGATGSAILLGLCYNKIRRILGVIPAIEHTIETKRNSLCYMLPYYAAGDRHFDLPVAHAQVPGS